MGFYEELSRYYDVIFPITTEKLNFITDKIEGDSKILDIACGTGSYSIALSEKGHRVDGIDLDDEMIKKGNLKGKKKGLDLDLKVGDMREIDTIFKDKTYNFIFCIGNSLVHLQNREEIKSILSKIYNMLEDGGKCLIQIINYDRIIDNNINYLPTIDRKDDGVTFIRNYDNIESNDKIYFNTEIIVKELNEEKRYENSIPLLPLRSKELVDILKTTGFKNVKLYGNFKGEDYTKESYATIAVGRK